VRVAAVGEDTVMPDVSIYVALITAGAGALGAGVSLVPAYIRDVRQPAQARRDSRDDSLRQACIDLLGATEDLLAGVANAVDYHGNDMASRVAGIRTAAAAVQVHALTVQLLAEGGLAGAAERLAGAAAVFTADAESKTDLNLGSMRAVDPAGLIEAVASFRTAAVRQAGR
jgi:hypothetical protein